MFSKRHHLHSASLDSSVQLQGSTSMRKGHKIHPGRDTKWDDFNRIFDAIADPIMVFDTEFKLIKINKAARYFFSGYPVGKKCFFTKHKFALACKNCPTWQTLKTGATTISEVLDPKTSIPILLKTYPIYNRLKKITGVVLIGRESYNVPLKQKR